MFLFKKKEEPRAPPAPKKNVQDVIKEQKETISQLQKKQEFIWKRIEQQEADAREKAKAKNKNGALQALKRKKLLDQQATALDHQIITLETTVMQLENAQTNVMTVSALKEGIKANKELGKQMDIDNVDQLMDEMQDLAQQQEELNEVFKAGWMANIADEDDLMKELEEMESDMLEQELLKTNAGPSAAAYAAPATAAPAAAAPAAPAPAAPAKSKREEEDARQLAELQAQLNFA